MFSKFSTLCLSTLIVLAFTAMSFGQTIPFSDDFEAYTVGEQLACQNPVDWNTWSNLPCDPAEDAFISDSFAYSGTNSAAIAHNTDLIKPFGTLTSDEWRIFFRMYIPSGKQGNIYVKSEFTPLISEINAMAVFFKSNGSANLNVTPTNSTPFTYAQNEWLDIEIIVNLNIDSAEFWCGGDSINSWQWTTSEGKPLQLICANFYGINYLYEMYIDDFKFDGPTSVEDEETPIEYSLHQNYPNPFNPGTNIQYAVSSRQFISLKVYDILGNEIATLVNEEKAAGIYDVEFSVGQNSILSLSSGIYFYRLKAGSFIETKKMIVLK